MPPLSSSKANVTLAFDTSTARGGVALLKDDQILSSLVWDRDVSHGELLTPALQSVVAGAGLAMGDLTRIAIGHGPGSFTGVRIAVNAARALGYALGLPLAVYDTSEILAAAVAPETLLAAGAPPARVEKIAVLINAHKNLVFISTFARSNNPQEGDWRKETPLAAMSIEAVEKIVNSPHLCVGDGFREFEPILSARLRARLFRDPRISDFPRPEVLGVLDHRAGGQRPTLGWKDVQALYIRASGAEEKREESRNHKPE